MRFVYYKHSKIQFRSDYGGYEDVWKASSTCVPRCLKYVTRAPAKRHHWWGMRGIAPVGPQDPFCLPVGLKLLGIDVRPWKGFGWQLFLKPTEIHSHHLWYMTQLPVFHNRFSRARSRDGGMPITAVSSYCVLLHCCKLTGLRDTDTFNCLVLVKELLAVVMMWDTCVLRLSFTSRNFNCFFWSATPSCVPWLPIQSSCIPYSLWPLSSSCLFSLLFKLLQSRVPIFYVVFLASLFLPVWLLHFCRFLM